MTVAAMVAATVLVSCQSNAGAQDETGNSATKSFSVDDFEPVYDDEADPAEQIRDAVKSAASSGRFVVCQVGGNWCKWCLLFADSMLKDDEIAELVDENFVYAHINVDKTGPDGKRIRFTEAMDMLGNPVRFGFPVFVVLDQDGNVLHVQDSSFLEEGNGYDREKVLRFFRNWTPKALGR